MITKHELTPTNPTIRVCYDSWEGLKLDVQDGKLMLWVNDPGRSLGTESEFTQWINLYQTGEIPNSEDQYIGSTEMPGNFMVHAYRPMRDRTPTFKEYGKEPIDHGSVPVDNKHYGDPEMMHVLYLPVKMAGANPWMMTEPRLQRFWQIIDAVKMTRNQQFWLDKYVYLTAKVSWVGPGASANRPGWHGDGFGSDDLNFVWHDGLPTRVCVQPFWISDNHVKSMRQFEAQVREENVRTYPDGHLIEMDQHVVHAVADPPDEGFLRTFVKVSVSTSRYNLAGNAHNYDFDYNWTMYNRDAVRNDPIYGEQDSFPEEMYPV